MAIDAKFDKIQKIIPHENSDNLEIAIVSNFPCVVRKGEFKEGDICFYIRDDSKLLGWDEYQERINRNREAEKTGDFVTQDEFTCTWHWQDNLLKYLGSGGMVKSIKLRGKVSMGILLSTKTVCPDVLVFDEPVAETFNKTIQNPEYGSSYLEKRFGIAHWSAPTTGFGSLNVKYCGLPEGIAKSDSENWENLPDVDLHLGRIGLITQKLDGTSTLTTCYPDGRFEISSRSMTFKDEEDETKFNIYQKFTKEIVKAGLWYAKKHNKIIAFRSETCCGSVQKFGMNKDRLREDSFVYGCEFPEEEDFFMKHGCFGTKNHFLNVISECNDNGFNVKHVPILGKEIITKDLLKKYNDMPADFEGVVINVDFTDADISESIVWQYKSKSREYLMKMK